MYIGSANLRSSVESARNPVHFNVADSLLALTMRFAFSIYDLVINLAGLPGNAYRDILCENVFCHSGGSGSLAGSLCNIRHRLALSSQTMYCYMLFPVGRPGDTRQKKATTHVWHCTNKVQLTAKLSYAFMC